ncbi:MAG: hypothetical protein PVI57_21305 [Gemmatimonadota bacterium]|jgi:serine/threonine-protein kinase
MLTGEPPHAGPTAQAILARILTDEVRRVSQLRRAVPPNVDAAVAHALEKLPADRIASAGRLLEALDDPGYRHGAPAAGVAAPTAGRWKAAALILGGTTAVLTAGLALALRGPRPSPSVFRATVALPESQGLLTPQLGSSLALSPDGSLLVYTGSSATGSWQLWMRPADALEATPIEATQASYAPVFSPDGDRLAYVGFRGSLQVLDLERGEARALTDSTVEIVDWTKEGEIYFYRGGTPGDMWKIRQEGGDPEPVPVVSGATGPSPVWGPGVVLPGGESMVVTRYPEGSPGSGTASVMLVDLESGNVSQLVQGSNPRYLAEGYLLWCARDGTLMAAPFDAGTMELTGPALPVARGILLDASGDAHYAVSNAGTLVYRTGGPDGRDGGLAWVRRDGTLTPASDLQLGLTVGLWNSVDLSPDGSRAALAIAEGPNWHVWVQRLGEGAPPRRVTFSGTFNVRPHWTSAGDSLSFVSNMAGAGTPTQLWMKSADGTGSPIPLVQADREVEEGFLSPDGAWVVYRLGGTTSNRDIYALRRGVDTIGEPLVATEADERAMALSPDGRWLAYVSDEGGRDQVFVTPFPDVGRGKWQVSSGGGQAPIWAHNGHELFFVGSSNDLMVADYAVSGGSFVVSRIDPLFSANGMRTGTHQPAYAVSPDDQRFLMISLGNQQGQLVWVRNWIEELRGGAREGRPSR